MTYKSDARKAHMAYLTIASYAIANKEKDTHFYKQEQTFNEICDDRGWSMKDFGLSRHP